MNSMKKKEQPRTIAFESLSFKPRFAYGEMARIAEVTNDAFGTELGTGFARMVDAEIPWTTQYDEVVLVLEGELEIETPEATLRAGPRDAVWLPARTELTYRAKNALLFYAIHPVDWHRPG